MVARLLALTARSRLLVRDDIIKQMNIVGSWFLSAGSQLESIMLEVTVARKDRMKMRSLEAVFNS